MCKILGTNTWMQYPCLFVVYETYKDVGRCSAFPWLPNTKQLSWFQESKPKIVLFAVIDWQGKTMHSFEMFAVMFFLVIELIVKE